MTHVEPTAGDVVRQPFSSFRSNPLPWLAVLGLVLAGVLVNLMIPIASIAAWVIITPFASALARAHRQEHHLSVREAWDLATPQMLRTLGYGAAVFGITFAVVFFVIMFGAVIGAGARSFETGLASGLIFGIPVLIALSWWSTMTVSAAAAGVDKPLTAWRLVPVGRSVGGLLLGVVVYGFLNLLLLIPPMVLLWAGFDSLDAHDKFMLIYGDADHMPTNALMLLSFVAFFGVSILMSMLSTMFAAGATCLYSDEYAAPVAALVNPPLASVDDHLVNIDALSQPGPEVDSSAPDSEPVAVEEEPAGQPDVEPGPDGTTPANP